MLLTTVISICIASSLAYLIYKAGMMGGADAKALIALSLAFPYYPLIDYQPIYPVYPTFIISVFENSVLLSISTILYFISRNFFLLLKGVKLYGEKLSLPRKIFLFLTASKYDVYKTDWRKVFPIEFVDFSVNPPIKKYSVLSNVNLDVDVDLLVKGVEQGYLNREIWGTTGLPMVIFITIGLFTSILLGDLVLALILKSQLQPLYGL